ncbi:MAG: molybdenum cofactor biosynthesis protein MoaE [Promethearchaeia archaeon]
MKSGIYRKGEISLEQIIDELKKREDIDKVGAILTFTGIVRGTSKNGKRVRGLKIDAYPELANESIEKIRNDIKKREGIIEVIIIHFMGDFDISEDLVYVIIACSHREEGFKALKDAVERYKKEIAVWKREDFKDGGSKWV